ncbi:hypothetical protein Sjap_002971 [Stephania japonica]|uniref:Terpene synthase N-terminal domain-containing protein n=1 Tax=Stephania japonica TaxID=461633 RepID=A0AAP0KN18_9MAGN
MTSSEEPSMGSASTDDIVRKSANYHPNIWGDYFQNYTFDDVALHTCEQEVEMMKEEVKKMLKEAKSEPLKQMNLVDSLQRLGLTYHFEQEIEEAMQELHNHDINAFIKTDDLYNTALYFRLLRQHGYNAPYGMCILPKKKFCDLCNLICQKFKYNAFNETDIFNKFKDEKGTFKSNLVGDIKGLLSLYEAAHLSLHGEDNLDDALTYATICLTRSTENLSYPISHLQASTACFRTTTP